MLRPIWFALVLLFAVQLPLVGCGRQEEMPAKEAAAPAEEKPVRRPEARVVVPDEVRGRWAAVKIAVLDKETSEEQVVTIEMPWPTPDCCCG